MVIETHTPFQDLEGDSDTMESLHHGCLRMTYDDTVVIYRHIAGLYRDFLCEITHYLGVMTRN